MKIYLILKIIHVATQSFMHFRNLPKISGALMPGSNFVRSWKIEKSLKIN